MTRCRADTRSSCWKAALWSTRWPRARGLSARNVSRKFTYSSVQGRIFEGGTFDFIRRYIFPLTHFLNTNSCLSVAPLRPHLFVNNIYTDYWFWDWSTLFVLMCFWTSSSIIHNIIWYTVPIIVSRNHVFCWSYLICQRLLTRYTICCCWLAWQEQVSSASHVSGLSHSWLQGLGLSIQGIPGQLAS